MPSTLTFFFYTDMQVPPQELTVQKINIQPGSTSLILGGGLFQNFGCAGIFSRYGHKKLGICP